MDTTQFIKDHIKWFQTSRDIVDFFPRILFVHGDKDDTVPVNESVDMYNLIGEVIPANLREDVDVRMRLYKKLDHNQCITGKINIPRC